MKNTQGGVFCRLQSATFLKVTLLDGWFSRFFKIVQIMQNPPKRHIKTVTITHTSLLFLNRHQEDYKFACIEKRIT